MSIAQTWYLYRSRGGEQLTKILPIPIFSVSETTAGLQLADISAGIMRNYYAHGLYIRSAESEPTLFEQKIVEYHNIIEARSIDKRVGRFGVKGVLIADPKYTV